jgi:hypothetical protein
MARKTINVATVKRLANTALADSRDKNVGERLGIASLLEQVLQETGNYNGFNYLESEFYTYAGERILKDDYDGSRRRYY